MIPLPLVLRLAPYFPSILICTFWLACCSQAPGQEPLAQKVSLSIYEVTGLQIRLPSEPQKKSIPLPKTARKLLKSYDIYKCRDKLATISITHTVYQNPKANLDGATQGAISKISKLSNITAFRETTTPVKPAGLAGREVKISYQKLGHTIIQYILIFVENDHLWQIQVVGVNAAKPSSIFTLKEQIFKSVSLPKIDIAGIKQKAEAGSSHYQFILGEAYRTGDGLPKDSKKAFEWFKKSAEQDYATAQYLLGVCYTNGAGTPKNLKKAKEWIKKSFDNGHEEAQKFWDDNELWKY